MRLTSYFVVAMLAFGGTTGCPSDRNVPLKPESFVGGYVYHSADRGAPHDPDSLTLRADGKYILVQMPDGHAGATKEGLWRLVIGSPPNIELDSSGYPVEIKGKKVRLLIDNDLGHSYTKIR